MMLKKKTKAVKKKTIKKIVHKKVRTKKTTVTKKKKIGITRKKVSSQIPKLKIPPPSPTAEITSSLPPESTSPLATAPVATIEPSMPIVTVPEKIIEYGPKITFNETTTVRELALKINKSSSDVLKKLLSLGCVASINQRLDIDTVTLLLHEYGFVAEFVPLYSEDKVVLEKEDTAALVVRPPVVTVMGHVDHGKTTLLDAIRETNVAEKESGSITQHIGAYKVKTLKGEIVFIDTPGHEAFTAMRARGAKVTDIVLLVIAADEGIMPQTVEAINHARVAGVPIIVVINKIDSLNANPEGIKHQLIRYNLTPYEWGGDVLTVEVSARKKINLDKLLDAILFKAELLNLKANPNGPGQGVIIELKLDHKRGNVATVLVQEGTLKIGDVFICGLSYGRIRAMMNEYGERLTSAGPGTPVEILGLDTLPYVGERFIVVKNDVEAREIISRRRTLLREQTRVVRKHVSFEDISKKKVKKLNMILKADTQGSLEAIRDSLDKFSSNEIELNILHSGIGAISESDVNLAISTNAVIVGFNVRPVMNADKLSKQEHIEIRTYRVIYELIQDIQKALSGLLEPEIKETIIGRAEVKKIFQISHVGTVGGCIVSDGKVVRNSLARLLRDNVVIYTGKVASLRRFKEDVKEVEKGYECGIMLENFNDVKPADIIETYIQEKIERHLVTE